MPNIITTLVEQHKKLQKDLGKIANLCQNKEEVSGEKILAGLDTFKKDLLEHLRLENDTFYVELLASMKKSGQNIQKTSEFIDEMEEIEETVIGFLEKYSTIKSIEEDSMTFKETLKKIIRTLNLRIESEEAGVYSYWGLF